MVESSDAWLSEQELAFLRELDRRGVRYLVVGMSAAILQGVPGTTQNVDLWFESLADERIGEAARAVGGFFVTRMSPPMLGGGLGDRFGVVLTSVPVRVLSLDRVAASKRAANRPKDALALEQIEETIAVIARAKVAH